MIGRRAPARHDARLLSGPEADRTAFVKACNGRSNQKRPSAHRFLTLGDAREEMEAWRRPDNEDRPYTTRMSSVS